MSDIQLNIEPTNQWDKLTVTQFELKFKHLYEVLTRNLDGVFTEYRNAEGHSITIPTMGSFVIGDRGKFGSEVENKEVKIGRLSVELESKASNVPLDIILEKEIKANILTSLATQVAGAVKRTEDQFVLDALKEASDTYDREFAAAGADTARQKTIKDKNIQVIEIAKANAFKIDQLIQTKVIMDKKGIPSDNRHFVASAVLQENLLQTTQATSSDYAAVKALVYGEVNQFLGFKFHWIPEMPEGGIAENIAYAFHKNDGVQAWGLNPFVRVYYEDSKLSNVIQAMIHGTAKVIMPNRMVCLKYKAI